MGTKDETIHFKIRGEEKQELADMAEHLDVPLSQFIREAAREKVHSLKQQIDAEGVTEEAAA